MIITHCKYSSSSSPPHQEGQRRQKRAGLGSGHKTGWPHGSLFSPLFPATFPFATSSPQAPPLHAVQHMERAAWEPSPQRVVLGSDKLCNWVPQQGAPRDTERSPSAESRLRAAPASAGQGLPVTSPVSFFPKFAIVAPSMDFA